MTLFRHRTRRTRLTAKVIFCRNFIQTYFKKYRSVKWLKKYKFLRLAKIWRPPRQHFGFLIVHWTQTRNMSGVFYSNFYDLCHGFSETINLLGCETIFFICKWPKQQQQQKPRKPRKISVLVQLWAENNEL